MIAHDKVLLSKGIELVAPHKQNRVSPKTPDGRKLKSYKRRWVVERFFSWMKPATRLLNRFDKKYLSSKLSLISSLHALLSKISNYDLRHRF